MVLQIFHFLDDCWVFEGQERNTNYDKTPAESTSKVNSLGKSSFHHYQQEACPFFDFFLKLQVNIIDISSFSLEKNLTSQDRAVFQCPLQKLIRAESHYDSSFHDSFKFAKLSSNCLELLLSLLTLETKVEGGPSFTGGSYLGEEVTISNETLSRYFMVKFDL